MGWNEDMMNENIDLYDLYSAEDEWLDALYENDHYDADHGMLDQFEEDLSDWYADDPYWEPVPDWYGYLPSGEEPPF